MNNRFEIPGSTESGIFVTGGKLGYIEEELRITLSNPDMIGTSEFKNTLVKSGWLSSDHDIYDPDTGKLKRKIIKESSDTSEKSLIPVYQDITENKFIEIGGKYCSKFDMSDNDAVDRYLSEYNEFLNIYENYFMVKEDNIGNYQGLVSTRDILGSTSEICVLCPKDGSYTSVVNLNSFENTPSSLRVGIAYSKGSRLFSSDIVLPIEEDSYIKSGLSDYIIEYSDGCIRVFPGSQEVTECVISYCFVTYEYLI